MYKEIISWNVTKNIPKIFFSFKNLYFHFIKKKSMFNSKIDYEDISRKKCLPLTGGWCGSVCVWPYSA